jgi:hypothetical protein
MFADGLIMYRYGSGRASDRPDRLRTPKAKDHKMDRVRLTQMSSKAG